MIRRFDELMAMAKGWSPLTIAVAAAHDDDVLKAVELARRAGIINAILIGEAEKIHCLAREHNIDLSAHEIIDIADTPMACRKAVELVNHGEAALPMKGFVETSVFLKAVLNKECGLTRGRLISHVGLMQIEGFDRLFIVTDAAMNIAPTLAEKADIIRNAAEVAHALGNAVPKVAVLGAVEKVNPQMPATVEAERLSEMNRAGEITGCMVYGPLALDNAVSPEAARHKGIDHPVAGMADILVAPNIEAGNMLNKAMEYFGRAAKAGIMMGAKVPIILTSRASSDETKMHSILLGVAIARHYMAGGGK